MKNKTLQYLLFSLTVTLVLFTLFTHLGTNLWLSITESEYRIPDESNILTFMPLVLNPGSGDWWIYGEDRDNFYYYEGEGENSYYIQKKSEINSCDNFNPTDIATWCR